MSVKKRLKQRLTQEQLTQLREKNLHGQIAIEIQKETVDKNGYHTIS